MFDRTPSPPPPPLQDNIAPEIIEQLQPLLNHPDFAPAKIKKVRHNTLNPPPWTWPLR